MNTKIKKILSVLAVILVIIIIVSIAAINLKNGNHNNHTTLSERTTYLNEQPVTSKDDQTSVVSNSKNELENMDAVEDANKHETQTDKDGEVVTKKDGNPDDGWSPLIPAEDVE